MVIYYHKYHRLTIDFTATHKIFQTRAQNFFNTKKILSRNFFKILVAKIFQNLKKILFAKMFGIFALKFHFLSKIHKF